jgi:hypothetical protein
VHCAGLRKRDSRKRRWFPRRPAGFFRLESGEPFVGAATLLPEGFQNAGSVSHAWL